MLIGFNLPPHMAYSEHDKRYNRLPEIQTQIPGPYEAPFFSTMSRTRELPMPNVSKFSGLDQAHATLLHCWARLWRFSSEYNSPSTPSSSSQASPVVEERQQFRRWLDQWEVAFTAYLTNAMPSMSNEDVTESRVLKANHLACVILATEGIPSAVENPEADLNAIVELAGAVLRIRFLADSPQDIRSQPSPSATSQLDVKEPLQVVVSRSNIDSTRARALELLSRFFTASSPTAK